MGGFFFYKFLFRAKLKFFFYKKKILFLEQEKVDFSLQTDRRKKKKRNYQPLFELLTIIITAS